MTVAAILSTKGRDVVSERSGTLLSEVCKTLAEHKIGAIVVTDDAGHIEGIISERDIVKAIGMSGASALMQPVSSVMTKKVVTCTEADSIGTVMALMTSGRFRHVPVVADNKVTGLISIGDVVKHKIAQVELEAEQMRSYITMT
ncbi:inosine-5-monophosphate dehydrogenase [Roseibium aquae]|uniref:Inosine-5-monophosphate dehydrogenase n=1 Tax=Roseibium aquae TaxID=1323746 RepID=A0A916TN22_9HYPH|nr:CBS domain-containing protein [Roseibium aquae]GGB59622.1 inosine-5-monophosphate dehydrogenase [Roseibium aquae]